VVLGPVPVIVSVKVPAGVVGVVATVSVEVAVLFAGGVTGLVLIEHVVLAGHPLVTDRPTALLKPFKDVTVIVEPPELPRVTSIAVGLADREKSGAGGPPVQALNLNDAIRVVQLNELLLVLKYWFAYQNVQSSLGSTTREV